MTEGVIPQVRQGGTRVGVKRDYQGRQKHEKLPERKERPRNAYTPMFEAFRDELDEHQKRRMKIISASCDVTALSKKIIFSLQRVRTLGQPLPDRIQAEMDERLGEITTLLASIEADLAGMNRYRYPASCMEEFVEAITFAHYLRHQTLMTPAQAQAATPVTGLLLTPADYVFGAFDLTGEMMRFATTVTALDGKVPTTGGDGGGDDGDGARRTIVMDMQEVSSMFHICPPVGNAKPGKFSNYGKKMDVMVEQVRKVERLGYGVIIRGNERPKGWMPDLNDPMQDGE